MSKAKALSILLVVFVKSALVSAADPDSCFWCITIGQTWDNTGNKCAPTGNPITKA